MPWLEQTKWTPPCSRAAVQPCGVVVQPGNNSINVYCCPSTFSRHKYSNSLVCTLPKRSPQEVGEWSKTNSIYLPYSKRRTDPLLCNLARTRALSSTLNSRTLTVHPHTHTHTSAVWPQMSSLSTQMQHSEERDSSVVCASVDALCWESLWPEGTYCSWNITALHPPLPASDSCLHWPTFAKRQLLASAVREKERRGGLKEKKTLFAFWWTEGELLVLQHPVRHMMQEEKTFSLRRHKCKLVPLVRSQMFTCGVCLLLTFPFSIPMWLPWRSVLRATPGVRGLHLVVWNRSHNEIILFETWHITDHPLLFREG